MKFNNSIQNQSVRIKLFISYLILFLLPLLLMGFVSYNWLSQIIMEQTEESYQSKLAGIKETIDTRFDELNNYAIQFSQTKWVRKIMMKQNSIAEMDAVSLKNYDEELILYNIGNSFIDEIAIYIHDKDLIISSTGNNNFQWFFEDAFRIKNMSLNMWNEIIKKYNSCYILPPAEVNSYGRTRNGFVYIQSLPPYNYSDIRATLIALINKDVIERLLKSAFIDTNIMAIVVDDSNNVIADLNPKQGFAPSLITDEIKDSSMTFNNIEIDNNKHFVLYSKANEIPWSYIVLIPVRSIMEEVGHVRWIILCLIAASAFIGCLLSYELALLNYRPLSNLVNYINNRINIDKSNLITNEYHWLKTALDNVLKEENLIRNRLEKHKPMLQYGYLVKMLEDDFHPNHEFIRTLELIDISFNYQLFTCIVICQKNPKTNSVETMDDILESAHNSDIICHVVNLSNNKAIICNYSDNQKFQNFIDSIEVILENQKKHITIGVGCRYEGMENLPYSYKEALLAIDYRLIKGFGCIISFEEIVNNKDGYYYYPMDKEISIANYLKAGDYNRAMELFRETMKFNLSQKYLSIDALKYFFLNAELTALKTIKEIGMEDVININTNEVLEYDTIEDMKIHIEQMYFHICDVVQKQKQSQNTKMRDALMGYINTNYTNHLLSLSSVSQHFNVSPSYLSRYFKEQFNCNFLEYVNRKRIKHAQELLKESQMDIGDIARTVGYNNDVTFRRLFKKYTGTLPSSYRESL